MLITCRTPEEHSDRNGSASLLRLFSSLVSFSVSLHKTRNIKPQSLTMSSLRNQKSQLSARQVRLRLKKRSTQMLIQRHNSEPNPKLHCQAQPLRQQERTARCYVQATVRRRKEDRAESSDSFFYPQISNQNSFFYPNAPQTNVTAGNPYLWLKPHVLSPCPTSPFTSFTPFSSPLHLPFSISLLPPLLIMSLAAAC